MDFNLLKKKAIEEGITDIEITQYKETGNSVSTFNDEVAENNVTSENEMFIRAVYNNHITSLYTENDNDDEIDFIINALKQNAMVTESKEPYFIYEGDKVYPQIKEESNDFDKYSQSDLIDICLDIDKYLKSKSKLLATTEVEIATTKSSKSIKNTKGLDVFSSSAKAIIFVSVVVRNDNESKNGFYVKNLANIKDINKEEIYEKCLLRAIASLGATSIKSDSYPVVFEARAAASLMSCFTSMFSGNSVVKKMSLLIGKENTKVFGDNITVVDDPFKAESFSKFAFDDEGVSAKQTIVVENGVLKSYLNNLKTAKMLNTLSTGNGFKDQNGNIVVSPTNLCFKTSNKSFDEMISNIKNGVLITNMMGQHAGVNAESGSFNLQAAGFMIENGKVSKPVTLIIVSGNIVDVLNNVVDISNDFDIFGKVGIGSMYVKSLAISGK